MHTLRTLTILVTLYFLSSLPAIAQIDVKQCEGPLAKDLVNLMVSRRQQLAFLRLYSDSAWEKTNSEQGANASIFGIKIGGSKSEFREAWKKVFEQENLNTSSAEDIRYAHAVTSDRAYDAYRDCLVALSASAQPVRIVPVRATPSLVQIRVVGRNPASQMLNLVGRVIGGRVTSDQLTSAQAPAGRLWGGVWNAPVNPDRLMDIEWLPGASDMVLSVDDVNGIGNATLQVYRAEGTARVIYQGTVEEVKGPRTEIVNLPDNHNRDYEPGRCFRADGRYCVSRTTIRITAAAGRYLSLPTNPLTCLGYSDEKQQLANVLARMGLSLGPPPCGTHIHIEGPVLKEEGGVNNHVAEVTIDNWSHGLKWQLTATELEQVPAGPQAAWGPDPIWIGHDFVVLVPAKLIPIASFIAQVGNDQGVIKVSDDRGTVGPYTIKRINIVDGNPVAVQYRLERAP